MSNWIKNRGSFINRDVYGWTTQVSPSASANTKGSWATVVSSVSVDIYGFFFSGTHPWSTRFFTDIAVGDASNKYTLIENAAGAFTVARVETPLYYFPMHIAAGSNVYMRGQSSAGGNYWRATLAPYIGGDNRMFHRCLTLGANTGDTGGQALTTTYAELSSSTPWTIKYIIPAFIPISTTSAVVECNFYIAIGSSGNEVELYASRFTITNGNLALACDRPGMYVNIAEGSRIAVKITDSDGDNHFDVILYCFG